jgi:hypothetical protein
MIMDTISLFHFDITGRISRNFPLDSLSLRVNVTAPSGGSFADTLSFCITRNPNHLWTDFRFPYCSHICFSEGGDWHFTFWQNTSIERLYGMTALGVYFTKERNRY